jgi:hypothetical protein
MTSPVGSRPVTLASIPMVLGKHCVRSLVLLKFKDTILPEVAAKSIDRVLEQLMQQGKIPFLHFSFGMDIGLDPERNHDYAIVADFIDRAAYEAYAKQSNRINAAIKPVLAKDGRVAVQYALPAIPAARLDQLERPGYE